MCCISEFYFLTKYYLGKNSFLVLTQVAKSDDLIVQGGYDGFMAEERERLSFGGLLIPANDLKEMMHILTIELS